MTRPNLTQVDHRPWELPSERWAWTQSWFDLLFAHWPIDASMLRPLVPAELEIETHGGTAWIGVVPFTMRIKHRYLPGIPTASYFPELNVRTYVQMGGRSGVWFFSLDAASRLAVWTARWLFHLPYYHADMGVETVDGWVRYRSRRRGPAPARFAASYRPLVPVALAQHGSLEHWLTERYCLFARTRWGVYRCGEIHHEPWPLQQAEAQIEENTMLTPLGLNVPDTAPVLHYSKAIHVALWPLVKWNSGAVAQEQSE